MGHQHIFIYKLSCNLVHIHGPDNGDMIQGQIDWRQNNRFVQLLIEIELMRMVMLIQIQRRIGSSHIFHDCSFRGENWSI